MVMFADDSKLYRVIQDKSDVLALQEDLDLLDTWSNDWLLKFNVAKCKIMQCGFSNAHEEYHMRHAGNALALKETMLERDLGVNVSNTQGNPALSAGSKKGNVLLETFENGIQQFNPVKLQDIVHNLCATSPGLLLVSCWAIHGTRL